MKEKPKTVEEVTLLWRAETRALQEDPRVTYPSVWLDSESVTFMWPGPSV